MQSIHLGRINLGLIRSLPTLNNSQCNRPLGFATPKVQVTHALGHICSIAENFFQTNYSKAESSKAKPSKHVSLQVRSRTLCAFLASALTIPGITFAAGVSNTPPIDILYGAYEIVGRESTALGPTYRGWMRIAVEGERLMIDRCINGSHTEGTGFLTTVTADNLSALRFNYFYGEKEQEATCVYINDYDNLPRFSCYTYPPETVNPHSGRRPMPDPSLNITDNANREVPGLESAFPIIWPVPVDYFSCE
jgi:hypothetical protein